MSVSIQPTGCSSWPGSILSRLRMSDLSMMDLAAPVTWERIEMTAQWLDAREIDVDPTRMM